MEERGEVTKFRWRRETFKGNVAVSTLKLKYDCLLALGPIVVPSLRYSPSLSLCVCVCVCVCSASTSFDGSLARAQEEIVLLRRELNDLGSQLASNTLSRSLLQVYIVEM